MSEANANPNPSPSPKLITRAEVMPLLDKFKQLAAAGEYQRAYELLFGVVQPGNEPMLMVERLDGWHEHKLVLDALQELDSAAAQAQLSPAAVCKITVELGNTLRSIGQHNKAKAYYQQAQEQLERGLSMAEAAGDVEAKAIVLLNRAIISGDEERFDDAFAECQQALAIFQQAGRRRRFASTVFTIGSLYYEQKEWARAVEYFLRVHELSQRIPSSELDADALHWLGLTYNELGDTAKALEYYQQALAIRQQGEDYHGLAYTLNNVGWAYRQQKRAWEALRYYQQALPLFHQIGDRFEAGCLYNIGDAYAMLGQARKGLEYLQQALNTAQAIEDRTREAHTLHAMSEIYRHLGQNEQAVAGYEQAAELYRQEGKDDEAVSMYSHIASAYSGQGKYDTAVEYYKKALAGWQQLNKPAHQAGALNYIGKVYFYMGEQVIAIEWYQRSLTIYEQLNDRKGRSNTLANIANAYQRMNRWREAMKYYAQSFTIR